MKVKLLFFALLAVSMVSFSGCNDDDDNYTPEEAVVNAFKTKYPDAQRIEWETKAGYKVADFVLNAKESEAWFQTDGKWVMTETDILFDELSAEIQAAFKAGKYKDWRIDDVDKLERVDSETVYVIEVEGTGEYDLYYAEDGTLLKEVQDTGGNMHEPTVIPSAIMDEIMKMYPNAVLIEYERKNTFYKIDIRDGKIHKEVLFDDTNKWVSTEWDIRLSEVPAVVTDALKASEYKDYKIDDVEALEKPDSMYYVFELESGDRDIYVTIKADGTIVK